MSVMNWLALFMMILVGIAGPFIVASIFHRRLHVPWPIFFIAAGFYIINLIIQIPLFSLVRAVGIRSPFLLSVIISPIIYAVCEEVMRYLSFRAGKTMKTHRDANGALMAGLGHGGTEAIFFLVPVVINVITALVAPQVFRGTGLAVAQILGPGAALYYLFVICQI